MRAWITDNAIDPADVLASVGSSADGAALLFVGTVREQNDGRSVSGMRYDAYAAMAESVLAEIAREAGERAGTDRISVVHRTGELAIGDASVAIAVSTPHRAEAFDAARYIIEQIKLRLPVWKHEHYTDGGSQWLDGATPRAGSAADGAPRFDSAADAAPRAGSAADAAPPRIGSAADSA